MDAYVQLTGNVGGSVEFRNNTVPVASFRLAHTPRVRRNGEWGDAPTTWITVTCFRALAENVAASLQKGHPVLVAGRLRTNVWTKDGMTFERLTLEASTVGHDLTRGTSAFQRQTIQEPTEDRDDVLREVIGLAEGQHIGPPSEDSDAETYGDLDEDAPREQVDEDGAVRQLV